MFYLLNCDADNGSFFNSACSLYRTNVRQKVEQKMDEEFKGFRRDPAFLRTKEQSYKCWANVWSNLNLIRLPFVNDKFSTFFSQRPVQMDSTFIQQIPRLKEKSGKSWNHLNRPLITQSRLYRYSPVHNQRQIYQESQNQHLKEIKTLKICHF